MKYRTNVLIDSLELRRLLSVDLAVTSVQLTSYDQANGILSYSVGVANFAPGDTPARAVGAVILSTDQVINNSDDIRIDTIPASDTPGFSQNTITGTVRLPGTTPAGTYYLAAALDVDNAVQEPDETNNYMFTSTPSVTVPQRFDLSFNGTDGNDTMSVTAASTLGNINITINKQTLTYPTKRIDSLSLFGLDGKDTMTESPSLDLPIYLNGGDGNDLLSGGGGNDVLTGGAGKDTLMGQGGNDRLNGNSGNDQLFGQTGPDRLYGGAGNDLLDGGSSGDHLDGGAGTNIMYGQGGNDTMNATAGSTDSLFGGTGKDVASVNDTDILNSVTAMA